MPITIDQEGLDLIRDIPEARDVPTLLNEIAAQDERIKELELRIVRKSYQS